MRLGRKIFDEINKKNAEKRKKERDRRREKGRQKERKGRGKEKGKKKKKEEGRREDRGARRKGRGPFQPPLGAGTAEALGGAGSRGWPSPGVARKRATAAVCLAPYRPRGTKQSAEGAEKGEGQE